jgi:hypothetical protein
MIENMHDIPYLNTVVGPEVISSMTVSMNLSLFILNKINLHQSFHIQTIQKKKNWMLIAVSQL